MSTIEGEYVLIDGKSAFRGGKFREFQKVRKVDTAQQAYRQGPMKGQYLGDLMRGNNKYHVTPAHNEPAAAHMASSKYPLNWLRIPSQETQTKLLDFDRRIAKLEAEKRTYMKEIAASGVHMEWDMAELDSFPFKRVEDGNGHWSTIHNVCGQTLHYDPTGKENETTEVHVTKTCPLLRKEAELRGEA